MDTDVIFVYKSFLMKAFSLAHFIQKQEETSYDTITISFNYDLCG